MKDAFSPPFSPLVHLLLAGSEESRDLSRQDLSTFWFLLQVDICGDKMINLKCCPSKHPRQRDNFTVFSSCSAKIHKMDTSQTERIHICLFA